MQCHVHVSCVHIHTGLHVLVCGNCMRPCWWAANSSFKARKSVCPLTWSLHRTCKSYLQRGFWISILSFLFFSPLPSTNCVIFVKMLRSHFQSDYIFKDSKLFAHWQLFSIWSMVISSAPFYFMCFFSPLWICWTIKNRFVQIEEGSEAFLSTPTICRCVW